MNKLRKDVENLLLDIKYRWADNATRKEKIYMKYEDLVPGQCYYNTKQNDIVVGIIYLGKIYDWGTAYDKISFLNKENLGYTTNPKCLYLFQPVCFITSSDGTKHIENIELYKDSMQLLENKYSFSTRYCLEEGRIAFKNGEFF